MDSTIVQTLTGQSNCILLNEADLRKDSPKSFTATIRGARNVYSLFSGTVLFYGYYKGTGTLNVAISNHEMIRYLNLQGIDVWKDTIVEKGQFLATLSLKVPLQLEYCTVYKGESKYPVRIQNNTYYKQNPIDILDGIYWPYEEIDIYNGIVRPNTKVEFTEQQKKEWYSYDYMPVPTYSSELPFWQRGRR